MNRTGAASRQQGGTIVGFLAGLILGLVIAVFVAVFVTRSPVPFINKVGKSSERVEPKSAVDAPDPNRPLYSKSRPTPSDSAAGTTAPPAASAAAPADAATGPAPARVADADKKIDKLGFVLQAGAFRSQDDAEGTKAKLALMGFEARVTPGDTNGQPLFRVRLGPYAQLDDVNRVRAKLAESGIEASILRQQK